MPSLLLRAAPTTLALLAVLAAPARAQRDITIYGTKNMPPELYSINLTTGKATKVTTNLSFTSVACARHPVTGLIYLVGNAGANPIATWDPATDTETIINAGTGLQYHRLGFHADGRLYGVQLNTKTLYRIDPATGNPTNLGVLSGVGTGGATGDLAFPPGEIDVFYYAIGQELFTVDLSDKVAHLVGGLPFEVTGLSFQPDGTLYGISQTGLYRIDPATAASTFVGTWGFGNLNDLSDGLPPVFLNVTPNQVMEGSSVTFNVRQGLPGGPLVLFLSAVDGTPFFLRMFTAPFDAACDWTLTTVIPPGLTGFTAEFTSFAQDKDGLLWITNPECLTFQ